MTIAVLIQGIKIEIPENGSILTLIDSLNKTRERMGSCTHRQRKIIREYVKTATSDLLSTKDYSEGKSFLELELEFQALAKKEKYLKSRITWETLLVYDSLILNLKWDVTPALKFYTGEMAQYKKLGFQYTGDIEPQFSLKKKWISAVELSKLLIPKKGDKVG